MSNLVGRAPQGARGLKFFMVPSLYPRRSSRPARGAWIEIPALPPRTAARPSRPARGAWIEIVVEAGTMSNLVGRAPQGARGLKFFMVPSLYPRRSSRPARGAWIEIPALPPRTAARPSRPARGAWIEIRPCQSAHRVRQSRAPQGARGLKLVRLDRHARTALSRPARGAWIEIATLLNAGSCRAVAPRKGRVD